MTSHEERIYTFRPIDTTRRNSGYADFVREILLPLDSDMIPDMVLGKRVLESKTPLDA